MAYDIIKSMLTDFGEARKEGLGPDVPVRAMFQSLTADGHHSVADLKNGFDKKVSLGETKSWSNNPKGISWIGSMGRVEGDDSYDKAGLKGEGIGLSKDLNSYVVHVDGTAEKINDDTPLSVYAGVSEFNPDIIAHVSFATHTDLERAVDKLTGGRPSWVSITVPKEPRAQSSVNVLNRSVPGGRDSGLPLKKLGEIQTIFAEEKETSGETFEGYYLPRESYSHADGIYYGLKPESPGFLHVHNVPSDIDADGRLDVLNNEIRAHNASVKSAEGIVSIGGHTLAINNAKNVEVKIMIPDAAFVKTGMAQDGSTTIMRPCLKHRDLEWESEKLTQITSQMTTNGKKPSNNSINIAFEQSVLDHAYENGDNLAVTNPRILEALESVSVTIMQPKSLG